MSASSSCAPRTSRTCVASSRACGIAARARRTSTARIGREIHQVLADVEIAERVEAVDGPLAEPVDRLEVRRGLQRLLQAEEGVRLQQPEVGLVRKALDQDVEERGRVLELLLLEHAAREPEPPLGVLGLEEQRVAVGRLGGLVVRLRRVRETEQAVRVGVASAELDHPRERGDRGVVRAAARVDQPEVAPGAAEARELGDGLLVVDQRIGHPVLLELDPAEREVEDRRAVRFHLLPQRFLGLRQAVRHQRADLLEDRHLVLRDARLDLRVDPVAGDELPLEDRVVPDRFDVAALVGATDAGGREREETGEHSVLHGR